MVEIQRCVFHLAVCIFRCLYCCTLQLLIRHRLTAVAIPLFVDDSSPLSGLLSATLFSIPFVPRAFVAFFFGLSFASVFASAFLLFWSPVLLLSRFCRSSGVFVAFSFGLFVSPAEFSPMLFPCSSCSCNQVIKRHRM